MYACLNFCIFFLLQKRDSEERTVADSRRTLKGIRSFFSSDRSSRTLANDNTKPNEKSLPSPSPKSPLPPLSKQGSEERHSVDVKSRRRTGSLKGSNERKEQLSVESNIRCITRESRSAPPSSFGSSHCCGPGLEEEVEASSGESSSVSAANVCYLEVGKRTSGAKSPLLLTETDRVIGDVPNKVQIGKSLSVDSVPLEKEEVIVMYTNSFDLK